MKMIKAQIIVEQPKPEHEGISFRKVYVQLLNNDNKPLRGFPRLGFGVSGDTPHYQTSPFFWAYIYQLLNSDANEQAGILGRITNLFQTRENRKAPYIAFMSFSTEVEGTFETHAHTETNPEYIELFVRPDILPMPDARSTLQPLRDERPRWLLDLCDAAEGTEAAQREEINAINLFQDMPIIT